MAKDGKLEPKGTTVAGALADARGAARLAVDGVQGVVGIVEAMHGRIARASPPLGQVQDTPTRGITGLVYRGIRGTTGLVGAALDAAIGGLQSALNLSLNDVPEAEASPARDAAISALNGIVGDHLQRTDNPLAIAMRLRPRPALPATPSPHVLLLVHGLCMNDRQWTRDGHDHGQALAAELGCAPVYARYNTGRHISLNGAQMAAHIETLLADWAVPAESLTVIGHSMGGLVARSAVHQATQAGMAWPAQLRRLVFLGSPHHGAVLERGGNWLQRGLGVSPYLAPFTRLTGLRSEGITDLRHGNLLDGDWAADRFAHGDTRTGVPLPAGVECFAVAGTLREGMPTDGLVTVSSALGEHAAAGRNLRLPASHRFIAQGVNHMALLSSAAVYRQLRKWLA